MALGPGPHPDFGEAVVAVVVRDHDSLTEADIETALTGAIARFEQPKQTLFLPELPRNTMGKVQKKALRERFENLFSG